MSDHLNFFIDGKWVAPLVPATLDVIDPSTEEAYTKISVAGKADVDRAVSAAKAAFPAFSQTSKAERLKLLKRILEVYNERYEDIAQAVSQEMGAPITWAREAQAWAGRAHMESTIKALEDYEFSEKRGTTMVVKEPIGVCALITPWNWPLNQIVCKVAPAIAAGCTVVLKPSEIAPISGVIFSEVMEAAGTPKGVYNMVNGTGPDVGQVMAGHPDVDMVSFTGSTRVGALLMKGAADGIKRLSLELGGNAPFIVFDDADLDNAVEGVIVSKFRNGGQTCVCANRILVQEGVYDAFAEKLSQRVTRMKVGTGTDEGTEIGPMINAAAIDKIERHIADAKTKGAQILAQSEAVPDGRQYARPVVLGEATTDMLLASEETFGPVAPLFRFETEEEAITIANGTPFGLAAYFYTENLKRSWRVAEALEFGMVGLNTGLISTEVAPFGGVKQSGLGREGSQLGIEEYLEVKTLHVGGLNQ
ncbi:MAG: aldehyde dehydrogenase family protein [Mesorhizobium sp.]|nr:MAG: aldehyde dehydrogenase family protein [Mesorhizobium sp.]